MLGALETSRCSAEDSDKDKASSIGHESLESKGSYDPKGDISEKCIKFHNLGNLEIC